MVGSSATTAPILAPIVLLSSSLYAVSCAALGSVSDDVAAGRLLAGEHLQHPVGDERVGVAGEEVVLRAARSRSRRGRPAGSRPRARTSAPTGYVAQVLQRVARSPTLSATTVPSATMICRAGARTPELRPGPVVLVVGAVRRRPCTTCTQLRLANSRPNRTSMTTPARRSGAFIATTSVGAGSCSFDWRRRHRAARGRACAGRRAASEIRSSNAMQQPVGHQRRAAGGQERRGLPGQRDQPADPADDHEDLQPEREREAAGEQLAERVPDRHRDAQAALDDQQVDRRAARSARTARSPRRGRRR